MIVQHHLVFGRKYDEYLDLNNVLLVNNVAYPVIMNGNVTRAEGHDGRLNAMQFGRGNLVSVDPLPASTVWSIAYWMKLQTSPNGITCELTSNSGGKYAFVTALTPNSEIRAIVRGNGDNSKYRPILPDGAWHHVVFILDRGKDSNNEIELYVDKVKQNLTNQSSAESTGLFISDKIYIGGRGNTYTSAFVGTLSLIKMFNYALSQIEIDNLYNE